MVNRTKDKKSLKIPKWLIRNRTSMKNRQHNGQKDKGQEEFEDTRVVNQKPYIDEEQTAQWSIGQRTRRV